jgi:cytochrome c
VKFPAEYDGLAFLGEYERRWIKTAAVNSDGSVGTIANFPWPLGYKVMDMEFGADGALYVLTYGEQYFSSDDHAGLFRIEHIGTTGRRPEVTVSADKTSGRKPLTVRIRRAPHSPTSGTSATGRRRPPRTRGTPIPSEVSTHRR